MPCIPTLFPYSKKQRLSWNDDGQPVGKWTSVLYASLKFAITTAHCQILRWSRDECSLQHSSISVWFKFIFFQHLRLSTPSPHLLQLSEVQMLFPVPCFQTNSTYVLLQWDTEFHTYKRQLVILYFHLRWFFYLFQFRFTVCTNIPFIRSQRFHLRLSGQISRILTYVFPKPQLR